MSLLSIFDELECMGIMCRGLIEGYYFPNGIGNIPWFRYFFSHSFQNVYRQTSPLPLILIEFTDRVPAFLN